MIIPALGYDIPPEELREEIRKGDAEVSEMPKEFKDRDYGCCICSTPIEGKVLRLKRPTWKGNAFFYLDERCYQEAKIFIFQDGIPMGVN